MPTKLKILAVIPARGGSKRLPGKNLKPLGGKSLIRRSAETATECGCFEAVALSTDCPAIAEEGRMAGLLVPFIRPAELATDSASSIDVLLHATKWFERDGLFFDTICLLQVTSPFVNPDHILNAVETFEKGDLTTLSSMVEVSQYPEWMFTRRSNEGFIMKPDFPEKLVCSSDKIPKRFIENGAIYLVKKDYFLKTGSLYDLENHGAVVMSESDSVDIDTQSDWDLAEFFLARK